MKMYTYICTTRIILYNLFTKKSPLPPRCWVVVIIRERGNPLFEIENALRCMEDTSWKCSHHLVPPNF